MLTFLSWVQYGKNEVATDKKLHNYNINNTCCILVLLEGKKDRLLEVSETIIPFISFIIEAFFFFSLLSLDEMQYFLLAKKVGTTTKHKTLQLKKCLKYKGIR